jgi:signal transduction histidine kinase
MARGLRCGETRGPFLSTATRRKPGLGWISAAGAVALALAWGLVAPWLTALQRDQQAAVFPVELLGALAVGVIGWRAARPAATLGPRGAVGLGAAMALGGSLVSVAAALVLLRSLGAAEAVGLALAMAGFTISVALVITLVAWWRIAHVRGEDAAGRSVPLRALMAGASGLLATAAWALASGHVLGQLHADAVRHAVDEARDLGAIVAERALISDDIDAIATSIAPAGGFLVSLDDQGRVIGGIGLGVGTQLSLPSPDVCRIGHRALPCALRRLVDGSMVAAAVPSVPIAPGVIVGFWVAGLLVALTALFIGGLIGGGAARDLLRVAATLDQLGRTPQGLDRPVVALSHDEIGALATALGRLRSNLAPGLAEYQAALQKAQAADQARTEFLTLVSAELRSPLDRILAGARTLLDPAAEPLSDEQKEDVRIVLTSATHLVDLIDEVLDISAIATGQVSLKLGDVDVGQLVGDVAKAQRPLVQQKNVEIKIDIETPSPRAKADERRLRQVVTNIISNAVKFTDKGSIEIAASQKADRVVVSVKDTGPGIDEEQLPKLFSEFVQLGSLKQRARGTGLGLAICKKLVEAHGGQVTAESQIGKGSTFRVTLPVRGPESAGVREVHDARDDNRGAA